MKLIQRILTTALCGALCLGVLPGAAAPPEAQPFQEMVTETAEPIVEATAEEEMPLLATMSAWSPGEVVNTWEGEPYTSGEAGTSDYLKLFSPTPREGIMLAMLYGYNPETPSYMPTAASTQ